MPLLHLISRLRISRYTRKRIHLHVRKEPRSKDASSRPEDTRGTTIQDHADRPFVREEERGTLVTSIPTAATSDQSGKASPLGLVRATQTRIVTVASRLDRTAPSKWITDERYCPNPVTSLVRFMVELYTKNETNLQPSLVVRPSHLIIRIIRSR